MSAHAAHSWLKPDGRIWRVLTLSVFAWLAAAPLRVSAQPAAAPWTATTSAKPAAQPLAGWHCLQLLALAAPGAELGACRRTAAPASPEIRLLLIGPPAQGRPPPVREVARLRDATRAEMRLFVPPEPCSGATPCLPGLVLVDQRDESSCYGTQVLVLAAEGPPRSIGFIDELRAADGAEACIGPFAQVTSTATGARISLPGPLVRMDREGMPRPLAEPAVDYQIGAVRPTLQRQPPRRVNP